MAPVPPTRSWQPADSQPVLATSRPTFPAMTFAVIYAKASLGGLQNTSHHTGNFYWCVQVIHFLYPVACVQHIRLINALPSVLAMAGQNISHEQDSEALEEATLEGEPPLATTGPATIARFYGRLYWGAGSD